MTTRWSWSIPGLALALAGCASVDLRAGLPEVSATVAERTGATISWAPEGEPDAEVATRLRGLLEAPLTAEAAVQIALFNNRDLQATYAELGLAQADLVQAGLLRNPILDTAVHFPLSGAGPELQFNVVWSFLDALHGPLRTRVARARFEEGKLRVTGAVLDLAGQVRAAFHAHQADEQVLELRRTIAQALGASVEVSRRRHRAGNISDLDLARDRAVMEASRLALRSAESAARQSRERLNELLGTWGTQARWRIAGRLPEPPAPITTDGNLERVVVERSLDLAASRQRILVAGEQLGLERATALVPDLDVGAAFEREIGEGWVMGPSIAVPIPFFDQGQARVGRAVAALRRAQHEYHALAVRIRAAVRAIQERLEAAQDRALYYRDILLPLHEQIVSESQLQYNAMQLGVGQLLRDREQQVETAVGYVDALREFWLAHSDMALLRSGRLPSGAGVSARAGASKSPDRPGH